MHLMMSKFYNISPPWPPKYNVVDCINGGDSSFLPHVRAFDMKSPQKYIHPILPDPKFSIMNHDISYFYTYVMLRPDGTKRWKYSIRPDRELNDTGTAGMWSRRSSSYSGPGSKEQLELKIPQSPKIATNWRTGSQSLSRWDLSHNTWQW